MKKLLLIFICLAFILLSSFFFAQGPPPTNLLASNITTTTVDLSWVDNGCTGDVLVKYRVSGNPWLTASNTASSPYFLYVCLNLN